jgi:hypothetical protein
VCRPWVKESAFASGSENLVLQRPGAGYNKIDFDACTNNNVAVCNVPGSRSTASAALTLLLGLAKKLPQQEGLLRNGRWDRQYEVIGNDLVGKILGIVARYRTECGCLGQDHVAQETGKGDTPNRIADADGLPTQNLDNWPATGSMVPMASHKVTESPRWLKCWRVC